MERSRAARGQAWMESFKIKKSDDYKMVEEELGGLQKRSLQTHVSRQENLRRGVIIGNHIRNEERDNGDKHEVRPVIEPPSTIETQNFSSTMTTRTRLAEQQLRQYVVQIRLRDDPTTAFWVP